MRFVILQHFHEGVHYDLMLEAGPVLRTWKLAQPPAPGQRQPAVLSFDHRLMYLDYEGPISGGRGHVVRWDAGTYEGDVQELSSMRLRVSGQRLNGVIELRHRRDELWEASYEAADERG